MRGARRNLQTATAGRRGSFVYDFVDTASFRLPRSQLQLSPIASFPSAHLFTTSAVSRPLSCTICTTCNPTRQPAGHVKSRSFPREPLMSFFGMPCMCLDASRSSVTSCRSPSALFLSIGSQTGEIAAAQARHFNYAVPLNNSLTVSFTPPCLHEAS